MNTYFSFAPLNSRAANSTGYADDNSFGPFLELPGKATFDFTLLFEETILIIVPSVILLLLIPLRTLRLWKSPRKVIGGYLQTAKIVGYLNLFLLHTY
jgi:ATP-binding cassette subfamily C (CFTR/MRP) protein 1